MKYFVYLRLSHVVGAQGRDVVDDNTPVVGNKGASHLDAVRVQDLHARVRKLQLRTLSFASSRCCC